MEKVHTNSALRKYCLDALATCLSGKTIFELMHTWTGTGSNGKTRMLNLMDMALGDYICTAPPSLLTSTRSDSGKATPELCAAAGARLLIMSEVDGKATINVAVMKELSGGEKIATRELYKKSSVMIPQFTMLLTCNDLSKVDSNDDGTWRRLKVLPFKSKFVTHTPGEGEFKADTNLDARMKAWAPYVLSMLQARYPQAVKDMATDPPEIKEEVMNYRAASDLDQDFLAKNMVKIRQGEAYEDADAWALLNTYRREGRDSNITLSKLQDKLARFGVPRATEPESGRKVFAGWRLASHGRV
jgi:P4 family phage/plasmid primase-like protien